MVIYGMLKYIDDTLSSNRSAISLPVHLDSFSRTEMPLRFFVEEMQFC